MESVEWGSVIKTISIVVGIAGSLIGWLVILRKVKAEREETLAARLDTERKLAYERGRHDMEHEKLEGDIENAHEKIRHHGTRLTTLEYSSREHDVKIENVDEKVDALSDIKDLLMQMVGKLDNMKGADK